MAIPRIAERWLRAVLLLMTALPASAWAAARAAPFPTEHGVLGTYVRGSSELLLGSTTALRIASHWATAEQSSVPLGRVQVQVHLRGSGRAIELYRGQTRESGVAEARFQVPMWEPGPYTLTVDSQLDARRDSYSSEVTLVSRGKLLLQSDKPLYEPSQIIHLRTLALRRPDNRPLAGRRVLVELTDPRKNKVYSRQLPLSAHGIAAVDIALADELLLGPYHVRARVLDAAEKEQTAEARYADIPEAELELTIARYVLPRFQVAVEADRSYYAPGAQVKLAVRGRYFHGQPVAGAAVEVTARPTDGRGESASASVAVVRGHLDAQGQGRFSLELPSGLTAPEGTLRLEATAEDVAGRREAGSVKVQVSRHPLRMELFAEGGQLVPELDNKVWVVTTYPDGSPAAGADVQLRFEPELQDNDQDVHRGRADALGVTTFLLRPPLLPRSDKSLHRDCWYGQRAVWAEAQLPTGEDAKQQRCMELGWEAGLRLRTDRAVYESGAPIELSLLAPGASGIAYLDVAKDDQLIATATIPLRAGQGQLQLPADAQRFGTLLLHAYFIAPGGGLRSDRRVIYVERSNPLRVEVRPRTLPDGSFRPGSHGRIDLQVVDAVSGKGVPAAVGVAMVDQALLALRPLAPGMARAFFELSAQLPEAESRLRAQPGGYTMQKLLQSRAPAQALDALPQEAAELLLTEALPRDTSSWESDPWTQRKRDNEHRLQRVLVQLAEFRRTHCIGERVPGTAAQWRYRQDLVQLMATAGALAQSDTRDAWDQPLTTAALVQVDPLPEFSQVARQELDERMTAIYQALNAEWAAGRLRLDARGDGARAAARITPADLQRLVDRGKLRAGTLYDPWGKRLRLLERSEPFLVGRLWSRFVLAADGPDGVAGTDDDRVARDESCAASEPTTRAVNQTLSIVGVPTAEAFRPFTKERGCPVIHPTFFPSQRGRLAGRKASAPEVIAGSASIETWPAQPGRVRSLFPETLLWRPEVLTDSEGRATLELELADSITSWRLSAEALTLDGRLGETALPVRVYTDFFVDMELPPVITEQDEITVPVTVHNDGKTPLHVRLAMPQSPWLALLSSSTQELELSPGQVGVRHFRLRAAAAGKQWLQVRAQADGPAGQPAKTDAVEKALEVVPDGTEQTHLFQAQLKGGSSVQHRYTVPGDALAGTSRVALKLYPHAAAHIIEGLDSMLHMPSGCFEQTSSTTYPNLLVLQYLRKTGRTSADIERRAQKYVHLGYQRLLSFEVRGGGFSLFGQAPASTILSAYGLQEFHDMEKVHPVDPAVLARTARFLDSRQSLDGSFEVDADGYARRRQESGADSVDLEKVRTTAYVALALRATGTSPSAVERAARYVQRAVARLPAPDAYTLALAADLLGGTRAAKLSPAELMDDTSERARALAYDHTVLRSSGRSASIETMALTAGVLLRTPGRMADALLALQYLVQHTDSYGSWHSTAATIQTLKALLLAAEQRPAAARGTLLVRVDGRPAHQLQFDGRDEVLRLLQVPASASLGAHEVELSFHGEGALDYQLRGSYYLPSQRRDERNADADSLTRLLDQGPTPRPFVLRVDTVLDEPRLAVGATLYEQIRVQADAPLDLPMVIAGLPPGFEVDLEQLDTLVRSRRVEKYQVMPREVVFYLRRLSPAAPLLLPLRLTARLAGRVSVPPPTVYEYYRPEHRAVGQPVRVTIDPAPAGAALSGR